MSNTELFQIPPGETSPNEELSVLGYAEQANEAPLFDDMSIGNAQSEVNLAFEEVPVSPVYEETSRRSPEARSPEALHDLKLSLGDYGSRLALVRTKVTDDSLYGKDLNQNLFDLVA